jgi:HlyD family secretion protein
MIRILLVGDRSIGRQGIKALLEPRPKLNIVGTASDSESAIEQVKNLKPDIVLMYLEMPEMNGITIIDRLCSQFSQTKILVLSSDENQKYVAKALQSGVQGYLLKHTSVEDLERAIWAVYRGYSQIESTLLQKVLAKESIEPSGFDVIREQSLQETSNAQKSPNQQGRQKPLVQQDSTEREQKPHPKKDSSLKLLKYWIWRLIMVPIFSIVAITLVSLVNRPKSQPSYASKPDLAELPEIKKVAALGRIEPQGEIMSLSAPTSLEAVQVEQLLVKIGDRVKKRQIIAILDGRQRQQATLDEAKTKLIVARSRLEKVKAGAKPGAIEAKQAAIANIEAQLAGEIQTQQATIAKLTAELDNARIEWQRNQQLFNEGAISASELDSKRLTFNTDREQLNEAKATMNRTKRTLDAQLVEAQATLEEIAEVRLVDVQIAQAEVNQAQAVVVKAQADMELAHVRAPVDGEILDIHTRPGEALDDKGIAQIGQTEQMMVVAEVDQNDIERVKIGQKATVTSGVFPEQLQGKVHQVGSLINKNDILDTDPAADEDSRIVEVEIMLQPKDSHKVAKLSNLEVDVVIEF